TRPIGKTSRHAGSPSSSFSRSRSCSGSDGTPVGIEVFAARPTPTRSPQRRARPAPACRHGRRAVTGTLCALGAIALWATLASLGVALAHVPPFLLTGLALVVGSAPSWPLARQWRIPASTLLLGVAGLFGYY